MVNQRINVKEQLGYIPLKWRFLCMKQYEPCCSTDERIRILANFEDAKLPFIIVAAEVIVDWILVSLVDKIL